MSILLYNLFNRFNFDTIYNYNNLYIDKSSDLLTLNDVDYIILLNYSNINSFNLNIYKSNDIIEDNNVWNTNINNKVIFQKRGIIVKKIRNNNIIVNKIIGAYQSDGDQYNSYRITFKFIISKEEVLEYYNNNKSEYENEYMLNLIKNHSLFNCCIEYCTLDLVQYFNFQ